VARRWPEVKLRIALLVVGILAIGATAAVAQTQFPTHFTKFKLERNSSSTEFKGKIDSSKSKCVKGRKVKLIRKHNGNKKTLGDDKTNKKGKFDIKLSTGHPKNGKYYARVKKKKFDNDEKVCLSVNSGYIKIS
jgi:5-hydroxyisourate hydrolase-like protein (transthyretin family)